MNRDHNNDKISFLGSYSGMFFLVQKYVFTVKYWFWLKFL